MTQHPPHDRPDSDWDAVLERWERDLEETAVAEDASAFEDADPTVRIGRQGGRGEARPLQAHGPDLPGANPFTAPTAPMPALPAARWKPQVDPETREVSYDATTASGRLAPSSQTTTEIGELHRTHDFEPPTRPIVPVPALETSEDDVVLILEPRSQLPERPAELHDGPDRGAEAALRTVRYRKPRPEPMPLVGRTAEVLRARAAMLTEAANRLEGVANARAYAAAAELLEQAGDVDSANALYERAATPIAPSLLALRALRGECLARRRWKEACQLLRAEAELQLEPGERGAVFALLAQVATRSGDSATAEHAGLEAARLLPRSTALVLLLSTLLPPRALGSAERRPALLDAAAAGWNDPAGRSVLLQHAARAAEQLGDLPRARACLEQAAAEHPSNLLARVSLARVALTQNDPAAAAQVLETAASLASSEAVKSAFAWWSSRAWLAEAHAPTEAARAAAIGTSSACARARWDSACAIGASEAMLDAARDWAARATGDEATDARVAYAQSAFAAGEHTTGSAVLQELAHRWGGALRAQVERARLACRFPHAPIALASTTDELSPRPIRLAAQQLARPTGRAAESTLALAAAQAPDPDSVAAEIGIDAALGAGDRVLADSLLRAALERADAPNRSEQQLAQAAFYAQRGATEVAESLLREAAEQPFAGVRAWPVLARLCRPSDGKEAAFLWLRHAECAARADASDELASAVRHVLRCAQSICPEDRASIEARLLVLLPKLAPADLVDLASRHTNTRPAAGTSPAFCDWLLDHAAQAARRSSDSRASELALRAATSQGLDDATRTARLEQALIQNPRSLSTLDAFVRHVARVSDDPTTALVLDAAADAALGNGLRPALLESALAWEAAGDRETAAERYFDVLTAASDDPLARRALDDLARLQGDSDAAAHRCLAQTDTPTPSILAILATLAELDLADVKGLAGSAEERLALEARVESHSPTLRALERHALHQSDDALLRRVELRRAQASEPPDARVAPAYIVSLLGLDAGSATRQELDHLLMTSLREPSHDLWHLRAVADAARALGLQTAASDSMVALADRLDAALERTTAALRAAEVLERGGDLRSAETTLARHANATPDHTVAWEKLARIRESMGDIAGAADAFARAAEGSHVNHRSVDLWYRAAALWQDQLGAPDKAVELLLRLSELNPNHTAALERLERLLAERADDARLTPVLEAQLQVARTGSERVALHLRLAELRARVQDAAGQRFHLRAATTLDPSQANALRSLAELCLQARVWKDAASTLIQLARTRKERDELRWVFFSLGDIYDRHLPDPKRAEAAFERVLKIEPNDRAAMGRLLSLYRREADFASAARILSTLVASELDPDRNRQHRLAWVGLLQEQRDTVRAATVLEDMRAAQPTHPEVLEAVASFYAGSSTAEAHDASARVIAGLRAALSVDPRDGAAWHALAFWLARVDQPAASAAVAAHARSLGFEEQAAPLGLASGLGPAAFASGPAMTALPFLLTQDARTSVRAAAEKLQRLVPSDADRFSAQRAPLDGLGLTAVVREVSTWLGLSELHLYVSDVVSNAAVVLDHKPCAVVLARSMVTRMTPSEQRFVLARAAAIARLGLAPLLRASAAELAQAFDSEPDGERLTVACAEWAQRVALLATGELGAALRGCAEAPVRDPRIHRPPNPSAARQRLVEFAVSDAYFAARAAALGGPF